MTRVTDKSIADLMSEMEGIAKIAGLGVSGSSLLPRPKTASPISEPSGQTSQTAHPSAKADDGLIPEQNGEEETRQKTDASSQSPLGPDARGNIPQQSQEGQQQDMGLTQAGTGNDSKVEKDMKQELKDPGEGTSSSALSFSGTEMGKGAETLGKQANELVAILGNFLKTAGVPAAPAATGTPKKAGETAPAAAAAGTAPAATTPATTTTPAATEEQAAKEAAEAVAAGARYLVGLGVKKADLVAGYLDELKNKTAAQRPAGRTGLTSLIGKRAAESSEGGGEPSGDDEGDDKPKPKKEEGGGEGGGESSGGGGEGGGGGAEGASTPPATPAGPPGGAPGMGGDPLAEIEAVLHEMGMTPEELLALLKQVGSAPPPMDPAAAAGGAPPGAAPGGPPAGGVPGGGMGEPAPAGGPMDQMMVAAKVASVWGSNVAYMTKGASLICSDPKRKQAFKYEPAKTADEVIRREELRNFIGEIRRRR